MGDMYLSTYKWVVQIADLAWFGTKVNLCFEFLTAPLEEDFGKKELVTL
jgi:hypothetical protein